MLRHFSLAVAASLVTFFAVSGFASAPVEVNTADQSRLESVKGIGPALAERIIAERSKGDFKDWADIETRVKGFGGRNSVKFSQAGLTVGGQPKVDESDFNTPDTNNSDAKKDDSPKK